MGLRRSLLHGPADLSREALVNGVAAVLEEALAGQRPRRDEVTTPPAIDYPGPHDRSDRPPH